MSATDDSAGTLPHSSDIDTAVRENAITYLFGGEKKWEPEFWTASDDRVRGGRSQSYLKISEDKSTATFHGDLDITALGGAGFASQRTKDAAGGPWDLSKADGVCIGLGEVDSRIYTLVLKDTILPKRPDGREQSTISYEFSFSVVNTTDNEPEEANTLETSPPADISEKPYALLLPRQAVISSKGVPPAPITICVPWRAFHPYYRGKRKPEDGPLDPLDRSKIKRISIMCRSMFGKQFGPFSAEVESISAFYSSGTPSSLPGPLFSRLENAVGVDEAKDTYILHKPSWRDAITDPNSAKAAGRSLIEDLEELKIKESE
ncbi:hypothetical protein TWF281_007437 [Arthrobotrys megalospora]